VPEHVNGQNELLTPLVDMMLGHSKGTISTQKIFDPLCFKFFEAKDMLAHTQLLLACMFFAS